MTINIPDGLILKAHGFEVNPLDMNEKAIAYLLQNGFSQSLTDSVALAKKDTEGKSDDEVKALKAEKMQKRFDAICAGEVGTRVGGPRVVGIDKFVKLVATEWVTAWAASKGKKLPSGKGSAEKLAAIVAGYMANPDRAAKVRAEAEKRMADAGNVEDFDFDVAAE